MKHFMISVRCTAILLVSLVLFACEGSNGPISDPIPQGVFERTVALDNNRELRSRIELERDSAFITDSIFSFPGGVATLDSAHAVELELNPAGDGYFRAVEEHLALGSDITESVLRYWFFFERADSLFFYRGMRFRGNHGSIEGSWRTSTADSAYIGTSYTYTFSEDSVTITQNSNGENTMTTYGYHLDRSNLEIEGNDLPPFGNRFEVIPNLALYITSRADKGYREIEE